ncbi:MAG TPA: hypothetical protein VGC85_02305, partial [Chthoniobacterales bacterium]
MPATTFSSPLRPDKTVSIAFAAVALLGFFEIAAVGLHLVSDWRASRKTSQPAIATETNPAVVNSPVPVDATTTTAAAAPPAATSNATPSNAALSAAEHLLQEATQLRDRGDTTNALARLQDAAQRDPKNANVLAELAMVYESIQLFDRSNETWRKIQDIGPSAGPLYELAQLKLKVGVAPTNVAAAAGPGFAGVSPLDAGGTRTERDGIPDGSSFGITEASVSENPDPDAQTNLTLRVGVKKRPDAIADHTKVKIQVYFYDNVENNKVALTDAEVNYEWVTPDHDWKKNNPEILAVTYVRMKNGAITSDAALAEAAAQVTPPIGS